MFRNLILGTAVAAALGAPSFAEEGDWLVRIRAISVDPQDSSGGIEPTFPNDSVEVDAAIVPELDITYMFTNNIGAELILATSPHDISTTNGLSALGKVADTWVLPPTLTLQYHFAPEAKVRPYAGVGLNYTIFYNEEVKDSLNGAIGTTSLELDDSFGLAAQLGFDVDLNETWFFNADVKYINIETTATLTTGALVNEVDVDINPLVIGLGIGRRF